MPQTRSHCNVGAIAAFGLLLVLESILTANAFTTRFAVKPLVATTTTSDVLFRPLMVSTALDMESMTNGTDGFYVGDQVEHPLHDGITMSPPPPTAATYQQEQQVTQQPSQTESVVWNGNVQMVQTLPELLEVMNGEQKIMSFEESETLSCSAGLTIVKFYASYCKICQRAGVQYKKIASEYPNVQFATVESMVLGQQADSATEVLRSLGVTKFPFVQIYRQGKCVASFSTGPSHMFVKKVRETIAACQTRTDQEWDAFQTQFNNEIQANVDARTKLSDHSMQ